MCELSLAPDPKCFDCAYSSERGFCTLKMSPLGDVCEKFDPDLDNGYCPNREDKIHCECWWDERGPCCSCGHKE
jgi:hypothetical protein